MLAIPGGEPARRCAAGGAGGGAAGAGQRAAPGGPGAGASDALGEPGGAGVFRGGAGAGRGERQRAHGAGRAAAFAGRVPAGVAGVRVAQQARPGEGHAAEDERRRVERDADAGGADAAGGGPGVRGHDAVRPLHPEGGGAGGRGGGRLGTGGGGAAGGHAGGGGGVRAVRGHSAARRVLPDVVAAGDLRHGAGERALERAVPACGPGQAGGVGGAAGAEDGAQAGGAGVGGAADASEQRAAVGGACGPGADPGGRGDRVRHGAEAGVGGGPGVAAGVSAGAGGVGAARGFRGHGGAAGEPGPAGQRGHVGGASGRRAGGGVLGAGAAAGGLAVAARAGGVAVVSVAAAVPAGAAAGVGAGGGGGGRQVDETYLAIHLYPKLGGNIVGLRKDQPTFQNLLETYAESRKEFAFWVGAGVSASAGLPTWAQLQDTLVRQSFAMLKSLSDEDARAKERTLSKALLDQNAWKRFEVIRSSLGETVYRNCIRQIFSHADQLDPPQLYKDIWSLNGVRSVLTLNIDNFAARSHRKVRPEEDIASFCGREAGEYGHVLRNRKPFIANLHGIHERSSSWVFTQSDLNRLLRDPAYIAFLQSVFSSMTVVFLGISADDVAAGGVLHKLSSYGFDIGRQFWITGRRDSATENWASQAGLEVIRYEPELPIGLPQDHTTPIQEIISSLKEYISRDGEITPVVSAVISVESLPSVRELKIKEEDDLRPLLAGHAKFLIESNIDGTSSSAYRDFLNVYSPCIYQAWHITSNEPYNKFYGYLVSERISSGQFSNVWKVYNSEGEAKVLKIIQYGNLERGPQLDSFRRGVQSLVYLTGAGVPGTAKFHAAYEIPTAVIIDFVEGDNLSGIVRSGKFDFWSDGVDIIISIGNHLEYSHNLPQSVLHRDVRPSNVMVPYYYWNENALQSAELKEALSVY